MRSPPSTNGSTDASGACGWIGRKNKPSEQTNKLNTYRLYLGPRFGAMPLDEITVSEIAQFRADLVEKGLGEKHINNILAIVWKPLRYAVDCEILERAPKGSACSRSSAPRSSRGISSNTREFSKRQLEGDDWYTAVCLAGEAGLRSGEVKGLRWREDVDMIAKTLTVNQQMYRGKTGTPKGRTRRICRRHKPCVGVVISAAH